MSTSICACAKLAARVGRATDTADFIVVLDHAAMHSVRIRVKLEQFDVVPPGIEITVPSGVNDGKTQVLRDPENDGH